MKNCPSLSKADSIIMEIIWKEKEVTSKDVLSKAENKLGWSRQTVKTYLDRLQEKGLIGVRKLSPRVHFYFPLVSREDYAAEMAGKYLNKYFGSLSHMMTGLIKREDVTDEELDDLERVIREYRNKK
jgi:BlaI family penicillinase repressor